MRYLFMLLGVGAIVGLDQWTKYLTVQNIPPATTVPVWDGVFHLTHFRNTGMAFSLLEGARWFFLVLTVVFLAVAVIAVVKKWLTHPLSLWALTLIVGGAIGNLIDRARTGAVVDMIELEFMRFAVFNVADCFLTIGTALLIIWVLFFDRKKPAKEEEKPHDDSL